MKGHLDENKVSSNMGNYGKTGFPTKSISCLSSSNPPEESVATFGFARQVESSKVAVAQHSRHGEFWVHIV